MKRIIPPPPGQWLESYLSIRKQVRQSYEAEWSRANGWQRFLLWRKIERETREELKKRFPPGALYAASRSAS